MYVIVCPHDILNIRLLLSFIYFVLYFIHQDLILYITPDDFYLFIKTHKNFIVIFLSEHDLWHHNYN